RYAQHIAAGQGFVYNAGEHVLGTTTPLYTLLLAALVKITHAPLPALGLWIASLADGVTAALIYALATRIGASRLAATLAAATFACTTTSLYYAESGMETSLFTCLLLVCCWRYVAADEVGWGLARSEERRVWKEWGCRAV